MTEQEFREKIKNVLSDNMRWQHYYAIMRGIVYEQDLDNLADALISARIGDVEEAEHRAKVAEDELARHKRALRIAGDKFINEVCNMRSEDIFDKCDYKCDTCFYDYYLQQAEKELAEENGGKKEV